MACGYRGPEVQRGYPIEVFVCPSCACDLYARPPRSYAEMEGVDSDALPSQAQGGRIGASSAEAIPATVVVAARWLGRMVKRLLHPGG